MSGPYPPSGYPQQPGPGSWPGNQQPGGPAPAGTPGAPGSGSFGQQPTYEFPSMPYGGLSGGNPQWGSAQGAAQGAAQPTQPMSQPGQPFGQPGQPQPFGPPPFPQPPPRRRVGRTIVAVVSVLVIIGGVVTAFLVLNNKPQTPAQASSTATSQQAPTTTPSTSAPGTSQVAEGTTTLTLTAGQCVTATVASDAYAIGKQATCGAADSDFVLAKSAAQVSGCEARQYLAIQATTGVYCFTLDIKQGDCLDNNYLKTPCGTAPFMVLTTENGPGSASSCANAAGATHWVPMGINPVRVACIGPPKA